MPHSNTLSLKHKTRGFLRQQLERRPSSPRAGRAGTAPGAPRVSPAERNRGGGAGGGETNLRGLGSDGCSDPAPLCHPSASSSGAPPARAPRGTEPQPASLEEDVTEAGAARGHGCAPAGLTCPAPGAATCRNGGTGEAAGAGQGGGAAPGQGIPSG